MAWPVAGRVDQDQVGHLGPLQLLDLAQDQDVPDAGDRGRHHVQDAGVRQPLGHALQPVVLEILDQRVVGRQAPGPHPLGQGLLLVAQVVPPAEGRGDPGLALELDDEHRFPGVGGHARHGRGHGRLADATLAGQHEDVALSQEGPHVHVAPSVLAVLAPADRSPAKDPGQDP